jgi:hypothetical protein
LGRVGVNRSGTIFCMAEKNSLSEIGEIPHTEADTLQNLCFVVAAFNEAI